MPFGLWSVLPPVVLLTAEGLDEAVHGLAVGDGDLVAGAAVVVEPRGDDEETGGRAEGETAVGGVVDGGEAIVVDGNDGETVIGDRADNVLFALGDAGGNEDGAISASGKAVGLLAGEERCIAVMAYDGEKAGSEETAVAVGVAVDVAVGDEEAGLEVLPDGIVELRAVALALQIALEGGGGEGSVDAAALGGHEGGLHTEETVAGIMTDVFALLL